MMSSVIGVIRGCIRSAPVTLSAGMLLALTLEPFLVMHSITNRWATLLHKQRCSRLSFRFSNLVVPSMMLQHHPGGPSLADISCSALVPCLSPPGTLTLDDFTDFTPMVKEELRLAIQTNVQTQRFYSGLSADMSSDGASSEHSGGTKREFGPEEVERRKRRRERNKVAAAKCRNKKKEKTDGLQKESEKLESVNTELRAQIEQLKQQKQQLVYMLNLHRPTCIVRAQNGQTPEDERKLFLQHIKELTSAATAPPLAGGLSLDQVHCPGVDMQTSCVRL